MNYNGIPENWKTEKLEDVCSEIYSGGTPSRKESTYWGGELNWFSSGETRKSFITSTEETITLKGVKKSSTKLSQPKDVLMATAGQGYTRGQVSYNLIYTYINQSVISLRAEKERLDSRFLYYNLSGRYEELRKISDGNSIRGSITTKMLKQFPIVLPPLSEQIAISNLLFVFDKKIQNNNVVISKFEKQAQAIFKSWFVDFEPFQDGEFIDSELGEIPKGWKVETLGNITKFNKRGFSPKYTKDNKGIPVINQRCIRHNSIIEEAVKYHDAEKNYPEEKLYKPYDVLINSMGVGTLGRIAQSSGLHEKRLVHSCITILRPNTDKVLPVFFGHLMIYNQPVFESMGEGTTGQTSLKNKAIAKLKFVIPPLSIQKKIEPLFNSILLYKDTLYRQNQILSKIRDTLLPKLMSGEIRVGQKNLEDIEAKL